uniref:Uncharacterized protein n=1 Tax=Cucumis melo TaxID=3656 RepID=A0A9I9EEE5_CUCME
RESGQVPLPLYFCGGSGGKAEGFGTPSSYCQPFRSLLEQGKH